MALRLIPKPTPKTVTILTIKYRAVNEAVDELALSNQKRIEPKMKESFRDFANRNFRKVYNLKSNTFQQVSCKIIHDVVGFVNRYGGKVEKN